MLLKINLKDENAYLSELIIDEMHEFEFLVFRLLVRRGDLQVQRLLLTLQQILKPNLHVAC